MLSDWLFVVVVVVDVLLSFVLVGELIVAGKRIMCIRVVFDDRWRCLFSCRYSHTLSHAAAAIISMIGAVAVVVSSSSSRSRRRVRRSCWSFFRYGLPAVAGWMMWGLLK